MGRVDRRWTEQAASSRKDSSNFEEGLVRIMFVAGALDHLTSFLAPHYAFVAGNRRGDTADVPAYLAFPCCFCRILCECRGMYAVRCVASRFVKERRELDAQAIVRRTGIGIWMVFIGTDGLRDTMQSRWLRVEIDRGLLPWECERGRLTLARCCNSSSATRTRDARGR